MEHKVLRQAEKYQKSHTRKSWLYRGLSVLAAGAVFCTTYALILPAITLDSGTTCGMEAHTHTVEECYATEGTWSCMTEPEIIEQLENADYVAHTHGEYCYDEAGELICPFAAWGNDGEHRAVIEPHEHTDECYEITLHSHDENCMGLVQGDLICGMQEDVGHTHGTDCETVTESYICGLDKHGHNDDCRDSEGNLVCGLEEHTHSEEDCVGVTTTRTCMEEERPEHKHLPTCYSYVTKPQCGIEVDAEERRLICDRIALHTHTDACYTEGELTCGLPEVIEHEHDETCYVAGEPVLVCQLEQHEHDPELCYGAVIVNDTMADPGEKNGEWTAKVPTLTGDWAQDLVAVAMSQMGYEEILYTDADSLQRTYTLYGEWAGQADARWDQIFISWCLDKAGVPATAIPQEKDVDGFWAKAEESGILRYDECDPQAGDIVILLENDGSFRSAIVTSTDADNIYLIMGDAGNNNDSVIVSYISSTSDVVAWVSTTYQYMEFAKTELPEEGDGDGDGGEEEAEEILHAESYYDWQAMQDLAASGWFTYWADHPTLYEEEPVTVPDAMPVAETDVPAENAEQIDASGGKKEYDENGNVVDNGRVSVSKTIAGTDTENVFDITLTVTADEEVKTLYEDPDMAIVIVMDISNTMASEYTDGKSMTKYESAVEAAEKFVDNFAAKTKGYSKLGFVAFNTDAHEICEMQSVSTTADAVKFKNGLRQGTENIINAAGYGSSHSRFTNMEAGLKMAGDMLEKSGNKHKFIVFLTDGMPTTYVNKNGNGYTGYDPYTSVGTMGEDGVFADMLRSPYGLSYGFNVNHSGVYCSSGTSYSDKAAKRASVQARALRNDGVTIFSVGVGLVFGNNQENATDHLKNSYLMNSTCVVDRGKYATDDLGNLINGQYIQNDFEQLEVIRNSPNHTFEGENGWLGTAIASPKDANNPSGGGYYYDAKDVTSINAAFTSIFEELSKKVQESATTAWIVTDPMNEEIKFLKLLDDPAPGVTESNETITWDLKNPSVEPVATTTEGGKTIYTYQLKYRVRLTNESATFKEGAIYDTNKETTLTYQVRQTVDGNTTFSEINTATFPIPSVHGYLGELHFTKVSRFGETDTGGTPLSGAKFELTHDPSCALCKIDDESVMTDAELQAMIKTATSEANGLVSFTGIPSGHTYILEETFVPAGHQQNPATYLVEVSYDKVTVKTVGENPTVVWTDENVDGTPNTNDCIIPNYTAYELPSTGGEGTRRYNCVGVMLMGAAIVLLYTVRRKQRE